MDRRDAVNFLINRPQEVALEQREGKPSEFNKEMYFLTDNRIMFLPKEAQVKLNYLDPEIARSFWITRRHQWVGEGKKRHSLTTWEVSLERPAIDEPASNGQPGNAQAATGPSGNPETHLERQLRESKEVRDAAANRIRAKMNLEPKVTPAPTPEHVAPEPPEPPKKPPVTETGSLSASPPDVEPTKTPERYVWFPNLIEVARSYTYKLNVGNYESRDFFCSQKAECRPEDADLVSEKLYEFFKRQVMKAVAAETGRKTA
jgi:hypothetical protein